MVGTAYFYTRIEIDRAINTADYLVNILSEKIKILLDKGLIISSIAIDNDDLMKSTKQNLKIQYPMIAMVPYSGQIMHLCFKLVYNTEQINVMIDETLEIIKSVINNKDKKKQLSELQKNDTQNNQVLKLKYPSEMNWTSLIECIGRLLHLRKYLDFNIRENFWDDLSDLYKTFEPFKTIIYSMQKDNVSLYAVWNNFITLNEHLRSANIPKKFMNIATDINEIINVEWSKRVDVELFEAVRLFNLEQNFKWSKETFEFILEWGFNYLSYYHKDTVSNDKDDLKETIKMQLNEFILRHNNFSNINTDSEYMKQFYETKRIHEHQKFNIILVWGRYMTSYYELSTIAITILSICPSEANVERFFPLLTFADSGIKSEKLIEAEMNIKINYPSY